MKVAYFGLPLGALLLRADGHDLAPIVLSPLEAPGRFRLARLERGVIDALDGGADLPARIGRALDQAEPDLLVSWFWTRKLSAAWLAKARRGGIGVHPSLLPRHRGPNPYFAAIDSGDERTGVTVHRLTAEYDDGAVLAARPLEVGARNAWQLARALDRPSLAALRDTVGRFARQDEPTEKAQDEALVTWAPEPTGELLKVDFGWTTERVLRRIRALSPTPGVALEVEGTALFVTGAEPAPSFVAALVPGEAHISADLTLRTQDGAIRVTRAFFPETEVEAVGAEEVARLLRAPGP